MGGPIVDSQVRVCPVCKNVYLEDSIMYEDPDRCPRCGATLSDHSILEGEDDVEN
jgi:uncharacterized protein with PIN domain